MLSSSRFNILDGIPPLIHPSAATPSTKFAGLFNATVGKRFPRHAVRIAKEQFKDKPITVVEIGSFRGHNALNILKELNVKKLYIIDPYNSYIDSGEVVPNERLEEYNKWLFMTYPEAKTVEAESDILTIEDKKKLNTEKVKEVKENSESNEVKQPTKK